LAVGVWVGFDQPRDMGEGETGGRIAAPIFRDFMAEALRNQPATPFRIPSGVRLVRIDAITGLLASGDSEATIIEAFRPGTEPTETFISSPFVWGGTEAIDPRHFRDSFIGPSDEFSRPGPVATNRGQQPQQPQQKANTALDSNDIY
jgi:membrane carboxypeptidase/penicillin-binding protein